MKRLSIAVAAVLVGLVFGAAGAYWFLSQQAPQALPSSEKEPLYWVAPMDANYRRDKPGKSPMGMDLVPVYADDNAAAVPQPGLVSVSPEVVNNLGVRTARAARARLNSKITAVGYLQYNQDQLIHVNPRIAGWIEKLHVGSTGARVEAGQPLYRLYSAELVNAQQELLMALRRNNAALVSAAEQRLRAWKIPQHFVTELRSSGKIQQSITFYAPQSGYLAVLNVRQGEYVQPGQILMAIGTLENIWVEAQIFASQAALVKPGLKAHMTTDFLPGKSWHGTVDYVYPALDPQSRTLPVRIKFDNATGELKPNMFADVAIHSLSEQPTTVVPKDAVIRTGQMDRVVLALGEGRFKSVVVTIGRADEQNIEILQGVQPGDKIVTSAQFLLDSESSKTADFARMSPDGIKLKSPAHEQSPKSQSSAVSVQATVHKVMAKQRLLNVTHEPIAAWRWPAMTMNFKVADGLDLTRIKPEQNVHLAIEMTGPKQYLVTAITLPGEQPASLPTQNARLQQMDDARMDHNRDKHSVHDEHQAGDSKSEAKP